MNNPLKIKYRITEDIDSNGVSKFYPERTVLGFWSRYHFSGYNSYKEANEWMCYKHIAKRNIHKVDEVFNKLVK